MYNLESRVKDLAAHSSYSSKLSVDPAIKKRIKAELFINERAELYIQT